MIMVWWKRESREMSEIRDAVRIIQQERAKQQLALANIIKRLSGDRSAYGVQKAWVAVHPEAQHPESPNLHATGD